jgi:hypothetical protein
MPYLRVFLCLKGSWFDVWRGTNFFGLCFGGARAGHAGERRAACKLTSLTFDRYGYFMITNPNWLLDFCHDLHVPLSTKSNMFD